MKKILLSLSVLMILGLPKVSSQITTNPGFETWTRNPNNKDSAADPNNGNGSSGWWGFNVASYPALGNGPLTLLEGTSNPAPESGSHYAAIVSGTMSSGAYTELKAYGFPYSQTNGILFTGLENISILPPSVTLKSGVSISGAIASYSFYYRYVPNVSDSCSCTIALYHWNSAAKNRTLLGGGFWGSTATQTTWTSVTVPITYNPDSASVKPDTVLIIFSACALGSANNPKANDTLDIDNTSDVTLGIGNISAPHDNVNLYPNPAQTEINLSVTGQFKANRVEVYDITGRTVGTYSINNNFLTINTQSYTSGLYLYKLIDNIGNQLNVGKFSVVK